MARITRLGLCGAPRAPYGSFAGKEESVNVPGQVHELVALLSTRADVPAILRTTDAHAAVFRSTEAVAGLL